MVKRHNLFVYIILFFVLGSSFLFSNCEKEMTYSSIEMSWSGPFYDNLEDMQSASDLVVLGTPTSIEGAKGIGIVSYVTIQIDETIKGEHLDSIILYQYGGTYKNETTLPPSELPLLEVGEQYLLYLKKSIKTEREDWYYMISGGYQGVAKNKDGDFLALTEANTLFNPP